MENLQIQPMASNLILSTADARIAHLEAQLAQCQTQLEAQVIKHSEERLRANRLTSILETLDDVLISATLPGNEIEYVSDNFERVIGYPFASFSDSGFYKTIIHPDDLEATINARKKTTQDGFSDYLHRNIMPDGRIRWLRRHAKVSYDAQKQAIRVDELIRDVTAYLDISQKLTQSSQKLSRAEAKFADIFALSPDSMMINTAREGIILNVNDAYVRTYGYSREELIGKNAYTFGMMAHPEQLAEIGKLLDGQSYVNDFEFEFRVKSGEIHTGLLSTVRAEVDNQQCVISFVKDITDRKQAEMREKDAAQKLRAVLDAANILLDIDDHDQFFQRVVELGHEKLNLERLGLLMIDPNAETVVGTYGTDNQGRIADDRQFQYPITDAERFMIDNFRNNPGQQWMHVPDFELGFWDGQQRQTIRRGWIAITPILTGDKPLAIITNDTALSGAPVDPFQQEKLALYASLVGQIWARKNSDQLLRESEVKYRALVEGIDAIILTFDPDGNLLFANQKALEMLHWQGENPVGKSMEALFPLPVAQAQLKVVQQIVQTGKSVVLDTPGAVIDPDRWFRFTCQPILDMDGQTVQSVLIYAVDITVIKEAELALRLQTTLLELRVADRTAQLTQTKNQLEVIVNNSADGIVLIDLVLGIQQCNPMFEQLFGLVPGSHKHLHYGQMIHPDDLPQLANAIRTVTERVETCRFDLRAQTIEGVVLDIEISLSPISQVGQPVTQMVGIVHDIRERKQAQQALAEERNLLRAVIDSVPDFIYVKDLRNRITISNIAHTRFMGRSDPAELLGKTDSNFLPPRISVPAGAVEDFVIRTGVPVIDMEEDVSGVDPKINWVSTTKTPLRDLQGKLIGIVSITHDISDRKMAQEILKSTLAQEKELGELRTRFISTASHEFRTPLATMMAAAESLEAYRKRMTEEQIDQRLVKIRNQGNRLKGIIDEVLRLSRMQSGKVASEPRQIDLDAFCRDVISDFENRPDIDHQIAYHCSPQPLMAWIDVKLLQPALSNLISNAIKYSPEGEQVDITVQADNDLVTIQIQDHGIGIPKADLEHLFEAFHRAQNVGSIPGTGLGLVITRQSIELHGGTIQAASEIGAGTTFTIMLPNPKTFSPNTEKTGQITS